MSDLNEVKALYERLSHSGDRRIAELAARQHGVVATWQMKALGYTLGAIRNRANAGRLHRRYRGVYAVGHRRLTRKGQLMAAVLACGPSAVLSHRSAVALWGLRPSADGPIDVSVPGNGRRGPSGIRVHNVRTLHPDDRTVRDGIPVTSVHRTLPDYAEVAHPQQLRLAIDAADRSELFDLNRLNELMERSPGRRVVAELDSWEFHTSHTSFHSDRRRDTKLQIAGIPVVRVTQPRVQHEPKELIRDVTSVLSGAWRAGP